MPAKKKPGSVHVAKNGARYKILANGRARFVSGPTKKKRTKKGGSIAVGGGLKGPKKVVDYEGISAESLDTLCLKFHLIKFFQSDSSALHLRTNLDRTS